MHWRRGSSESQQVGSIARLYQARRIQLFPEASRDISEKVNVATLVAIVGVVAIVSKFGHEYGLCAFLAVSITIVPLERFVAKTYKRLHDQSLEKAKKEHPHYSHFLKYQAAKHRYFLLLREFEKNEAIKRKEAEERARKQWWRTKLLRVRARVGGFSKNKRI
jgi:hypothetical protein